MQFYHKQEPWVKIFSSFFQLVSTDTSGPLISDYPNNRILYYHYRHSLEGRGVSIERH